MEFETAHDVIEAMSEWERGWYHACISTLWYNTANVPKRQVQEMSLPVFEEAGIWIIARYSRSGTQRHAESFYSPDPDPAEDLVTIVFDPIKFQAVWMELDSEAAINNYRLVDVTTYSRGDYKSHFLCCLIASTESEWGLPDTWELWPTDDPMIVELNADELKD